MRHFPSPVLFSSLSSLCRRVFFWRCAVPVRRVVGACLCRARSETPAAQPSTHTFPDAAARFPLRQYGVRSVFVNGPCGFIWHCSIVHARPIGARPFPVRGRRCFAVSLPGYSRRAGRRRGRACGRGRGRGVLFRYGGSLSLRGFLRVCPPVYISLVSGSARRPFWPFCPLPFGRWPLHALRARLYTIALWLR